MAFILVGTDACAVVALLMSAPFKVGDWVNVTGEKTIISRPLFIYEQKDHSYQDRLGTHTREQLKKHTPFI